MSGSTLVYCLSTGALVTAAAVGLGHDVFGGGGLLLLKVDVRQSNVGAKLVGVVGNGLLSRAIASSVSNFQQGLG